MGTEDSSAEICDPDSLPTRYILPDLD